MKYTKTVEVQRYRNHKNELIKLKGSLQSYYYKNKRYPETPFGISWTPIDDDTFTYTYLNPTPETFQIATIHNRLGYTCQIWQNSSYPQCSGNLPE